MTQAIRVPMPEPSEDLQRYFDDMVENDQFGLALDFAVGEFGPRARMSDLEVTGAMADQDGIAVSYLIHWETPHACDGEAPGGRVARVARGLVDGTDWVFQMAALPAARGTREEL